MPLASVTVKCSVTQESWSLMLDSTWQWTKVSTEIELVTAIKIASFSLGAASMSAQNVGIAIGTIVPIHPNGIYLISAIAPDGTVVEIKPSPVRLAQKLAKILEPYRENPGDKRLLELREPYWHHINRFYQHASSCL